MTDGEDEGRRPWTGARIARATLTAPIRLYQGTLSRLLPSVCRFTPSCSTYMIQAITIHGALRGLGMGMLRILRCNPFCPGGDDPVPPRRRRTARAGSQGARKTETRE